MSSKEDKKRKWILSLGFSEAEADSFIEFDVPKRKIEALAEVLYPKPEPQTEPEPEPDKIPDGMFWCGKHQTLHKMTSSVGKKCLKRIEADKKESEEPEPVPEPETEPTES